MVSRIPHYSQNSRKKIPRGLRTQIGRSSQDTTVAIAQSLADVANAVKNLVSPAASSAPASTPTPLSLKGFVEAFVKGVLKGVDGHIDLLRDGELAGKKVYGLLIGAFIVTPLTVMAGKAVNKAAKKGQKHSKNIFRRTIESADNAVLATTGSVKRVTRKGSRKIESFKTSRAEHKLENAKVKAEKKAANLAQKAGEQVMTAEKVVIQATEKGVKAAAKRLFRMA